MQREKVVQYLHHHHSLGAALPVLILCWKMLRHLNWLHGPVIVIVITLYSPSCLGQETAKGPFGLRVKLPPAHLSTTHDGSFTLSLQLLNVKQGSCEYQFL